MQLASVSKLLTCSAPRKPSPRKLKASGYRRKSERKIRFSATAASASSSTTLIVRGAEGFVAAAGLSVTRVCFSQNAAQDGARFVQV